MRFRHSCLQNQTTSCPPSPSHYAPSSTLRKPLDKTMALTGPIPAASLAGKGYGCHHSSTYTPTMEEQLLLFSRRHDFTTCPPSPSRLMPRRLALLASSSPVHSPTTDRHKPPMFLAAPSTPAKKAANEEAADCEQSVAQTAVEMLEAHLHSVLPLPAMSSLSSLASFSSLFVSPPSSPTISRLLSSQPAAASSSFSFLSPFSSPSSSPVSSPSTFAPSKLARSMKKHVRPSKDEKDYFKHLFSPQSTKKKSKKSSGKKEKGATMDDEDVDEWRELLEQFEVSKYFVGSAAASSSRARWQAALMLAYRDANKVPSTNTAKRSRHHKRTTNKKGEQKRNDALGWDRGDELQAAARLVVEMNHIWDIAHQLMLGKLEVERLRRAKDSATWTLVDLPPSQPLSTSSPTCEAGDKVASFRFTLMSSIGYFTNSILPSSSTSPPPSPSMPADSLPAKPLPSTSPTAASSPPPLEETIFGCPSFPSTPGTARLRPRPRQDEEGLQLEAEKITMKRREAHHQLSAAEGEVVVLLLADLLVKQMTYELCLSGLLSRVVADAQ